MASGNGLDACAQEASALARETQSRWHDASGEIGGQVQQTGSTEHITGISVVIEHGARALEAAGAEIGAALSRL